MNMEGGMNIEGRGTGRRDREGRGTVIIGGWWPRCHWFMVVLGICCLGCGGVGCLSLWVCAGAGAHCCWCMVVVGSHHCGCVLVLGTHRCCAWW